MGELKKPANSFLKSANTAILFFFEIKIYNGIKKAPRIGRLFSKYQFYYFLKWIWKPTPKPNEPGKSPIL
jgi:hypothetical protein